VKVERRSIDTDPNPAFPIYSAGNFAEVAPSRWSVMSWSLIGDPVERAMRGFVARVWPGATWATGSHYVFVGYFGCKPYHNLTALCQLASDMPGLHPDDVTAAYFESVGAPSVRNGARMSWLNRVAALPRMASELLSLRPRLQVAEARTTEVESLIDRALESGSSVLLGRAIGDALQALDDAWSVHYSTTTALVPLSSLQREVGARRLDYWDDAELLVNRPRELVWRRLFASARSEAALHRVGFLDDAFYEVADGVEPWRSYALRFVPSPAAEGTPRLDEHDPGEALWRMHRDAHSRGLEALSRSVADTMETREATKSIAMRNLHVFRRALPVLAAEAGVPEASWPYLRFDELIDGGKGSVLVELSERRKAECEVALKESFSDHLDFSGGNERSAKSMTPPAPKTGQGVSPGIVSGLVSSPESLDLDAVSNPVVLVCESADANIQPLLSSVAGVITARGSMLSHVAILVREHGIPAVVNCPVALDLQTGQRVSLNGTTGEVTILG
jgi:rifampicin phosphotransferase